LAVAIPKKMTEAKIKALVKWVKEGHQPEDFGKKVTPEAGVGKDSLKSAAQEAIEKATAHIQAHVKGQGGAIASLSLVWKIILAFLSIVKKAIKPFGKFVLRWIGKIIGFIFWHGPKRLVGYFIRLVGSILGKPAKEVLQLLVLLGLLFGIYMFFFHPAGLGAWTRNQLGKAWHCALSFAAGAQKTAPLTSMPRSQVEGHNLREPITEKGMGASVSTAVVTPPPAPIKPRHVSNTNAKVKKGFIETQNSTLKTQNSVAPSSNPTPVVSAPVVNERDAESDFVLRFAQALYSIGYQNYQDRETTLLGWVTQDYAGDLKNHYFNPYVLKNMESLHRIKTFTPDGPMKWVFSNETTEEFTVSGTITLQGGWNGQASNYNKTVKTHIQIIHDVGGKCLVKKIDEQISE
jgi:hypothetical protein